MDDDVHVTHTIFQMTHRQSVGERKRKKRKLEKQPEMDNLVTCSNDIILSGDRESEKRQKKLKHGNDHEKNDLVPDSSATIFLGEERKKKKKKKKKHNIDCEIDDLVTRSSDTVPPAAFKETKIIKENDDDKVNDLVTQPNDLIIAGDKRKSKKKKHQILSCDNDEGEFERKTKMIKQEIDHEMNNLESADPNLSGDERKSKKKKKHRNHQNNEMNLATESTSDIILSHDNDDRKSENIEKKQEYGHEMNDLVTRSSDTVFSGDERKKKKKNKHKKDHETNDLVTRTCETVYSGDERKKKKSKKEKKDHEMNDSATLPSDTVFSGDKRKKKKKNKKHKKDHERNDLVTQSSDTVFSGDERNKKEKNKKHKKDHERNDLVTQSSDTVFSGDERKKKEKNKKHKKDHERSDLVTQSSDTVFSGDERQTEKSMNPEPDNEVNLVTQSNDVFQPGGDDRENEKRKNGTNQITKDLPALILTENQRCLVHLGENSGSHKRYHVHTRVLKEMGIMLRTGKWIPQEDDILRKNFNDFTKDYPVAKDNQHLIKLLFLSSSPEDFYNLRAFIKDSWFYVRLAGNLRRLTWSCIERARKILPEWRTGPFTEEEDTILQQLYRTYGPKWAIIGFEMQRQRNSVYDHYHLISSRDRGKGHWTEEENNALINIIADVMGTDDFESMPHYDFPWTIVGKRMLNRTEKQCRRKWVECLRGRGQIKEAKHQKLKVVDTKTLVTTIFNLNVETENEIDWISLLDDFPNIKTPQCLKRRWSAIKTTVPGYMKMTFHEVRNEAYAKYCITEKD